MKKFTPILVFLIFLVISYFLEFQPGIEIEQNFRKFLISMIAIIPSAFILISLFEVWINRETVERHMGEKSIIRGFVWAIILASTIVGGLYVSFPVAGALYKKGAKASVVFTFLFASTICRIPMTVFEANFLGIKFTLIRFLISFPLVIVSSIVLGKIAEKSGIMKKLAE